MEKNFIISNKLEEISKLAEQIEELAEIWDLPMPLTMKINLVLEEAISNIIFYAYPDQKNHEINISVSLQNDQLKIHILDDGIAFDPTTTEQPDINLPADERPVGGLGIFLISKIMDEVNYKRFEEKNSLTLLKKI